MFSKLSAIVLALAFFLNLTTALPHFGWNPKPSGGFPMPSGGFPSMPTGALPTGFPTGWIPSGNMPAPTGYAAQSYEKRFEGARHGSYPGFHWAGGYGGHQGGESAPAPTATAAPYPTGSFPTGSYPTAPVPTGY